MIIPSEQIVFSKSKKEIFLLEQKVNEWIFLHQSCLVFKKKKKNWQQ